jgi:hypothetical protein
MIAVIQRYKLLIIILSFIVFVLLLWLFVTRLNVNKIPSRGVFVIQEWLSDRTA